jgi:hypothetical protein
MFETSVVLGYNRYIARINPSTYVVFVGRPPNKQQYNFAYEADPVKAYLSVRLYFFQFDIGSGTCFLRKRRSTVHKRDMVTSQVLSYYNVRYCRMSASK